MSFWDGWRYRIGAVLHPRRRARDREREMDVHLALDAAQRTHAARGALSSREASLQALRKFGNVTYLREETRRMSAPEWLDTVERDLRFAGRSVRRAPAFTVAVVLTFALGIGANAAMFTVLDRMLFRPPPHLTDPNRVHRLYLAETIRGKQVTGPPGEYARYADIARWTSSFDRVAGFSESDIAVGDADDSREMRIAMVSSSFFGLFDAPTALGRYFGPTEDVPGHGEHVAVASYATWQTAYGGRQDILGTKVRIGANLYDIVGVAADGFVGLWPSQPPAYFVPLATFGDDAARAQLPEPDRSHWWTTYHWAWMNMIARTRAGVSDAQANADLTQAVVKSAQAERIESPDMPPIASLRLHALAGSILTERGPETSGFAKVAELVGGVAIVVLLIACVNVANLLLTRALRRRREIALRLALGVGRGRLLAQLVTENMLLALAGGAAGLAVAHWGGIGLRLAFLPNARSFAVLGDERTLAFVMVAALGAGVLTSLAPILQANRANLTSDLKSGAREGTYQRSRLRTVLLVAQGALSVLLLVGAGLFVQSLNHVRRIRLGYDVDPMLIVEINMRGATLDSAHAVQLRQRLLERARATPGVRNATLQIGTPFWGTQRNPLFVAGIDTVARLGRFDATAVSPEYFATFGTRILRGRGVLATDLEHAPLVMVVSQKMAAALWPGAEALGKCVRVGADTSPCRTVVGIAEDIKSHALSDDPDMYYYLPAAQYEPNRTGLFVRVDGDAGPYAESVRQSLQHEMPDPAYVTVTPFAQIVGEQVRSWKLGASMFTAFGLLALVLAAIGLYCVIAYTVVQRTHEIGVRMALGARGRDVLRLVVLESVRIALIGIAIGGGVALAVAPRLAPLLFQESPRDPSVYIGVAVVLMAVSVAAGWFPAYRGSRIDPTRALRYE